jgi:hypothetical protein
MTLVTPSTYRSRYAGPRALGKFPCILNPFGPAELFQASPTAPRVEIYHPTYPLPTLTHGSFPRYFAAQLAPQQKPCTCLRPCLLHSHMSTPCDRQTCLQGLPVRRPSGHLFSPLPSPQVILIGPRPPRACQTLPCPSLVCPLGAVASRVGMPAYYLHDCHYFFRTALRGLNISTSVSPLYL